MSDIEEVQQQAEKPVTPKENLKVQDEPIKDESPLNYMDDIEYHRIADFFDLQYNDRKDVHNAEKLSFLYDWASEEIGSKKRIDVLMKLKSVAEKMGWQFKGKELITKLYRWSRLVGNIKDIRKEMELLK